MIQCCEGRFYRYYKIKPQTPNPKPQTPSHTLLTTFYLSAYLPLISYNHNYGCYSPSTAQLYRVWHTT
ncbi:hypothetical protein PROSTU_00126 [Providencia stuartii ATCC 25827]|uniref:Uncharacterized protein n=1 Tax=Providencia stuartii ATCC 25827 TaxID=471874 RepID=A0AA86Z4C1_PROST|nr:hypothetical protein PROSTU_00126 [Providencia stuartii ATCC 25827]